MPKNKVVIPFRTGDVVEFVGEDGYWKKRDKHIIKEVWMHSPQEFEYSTNRGAWIEHKDLKLVKEADLESLTQLYKESTSDDD